MCRMAFSRFMRLRFSKFLSLIICYSDGWWNKNETCFRATDNMTANDILLKNYAMHNVTKNGVVEEVRKTTTPVEEYWEHRVLQINGGLEFGLGSIQWELAG